jgi:hypothetical protein
MSAKILYYFAITLYVTSFFLPAAYMFGSTVIGYDCALVIFSTLTEWKGIVDYIFNLFFNLANILTILGFLVHFKFGIDKMFIPQLIALLSSFFWIVNAIFSNPTFNDLLIGYWIWFISILLMSYSSFLLRRGYTVLLKPINSANKRMDSD